MRVLSRDDAGVDLARLLEEVECRHSYIARSRAEFNRAVELTREVLRTRGDLAVEEFGVLLMKALAKPADGHVGVDGAPDAFLPRGYSPCLFWPVAGRIVAFREDRSGFVDGRRPYVTSMDGVGIEDWLRVGSELVPLDTPGAARLGAAKLLRFVSYIRRELGLPARDEIRLVTEDEDSGSQEEHLLPLATHKPIYGDGVPRPSGLLSPGLAYLRIGRMGRDTAAVQDMMSSFQRTDGLFIDLRGNGGGSRDFVPTLVPRFLGVDEPARVVNVASYRLQPRDPDEASEGYLSDRALFPASATVWTETERVAITRTAAAFTPSWPLPSDQRFSP